MLPWIGVILIIGGLVVAYDYYDKEQKKKKGS
jgi:hypothetical protein